MSSSCCFFFLNRTPDDHYQDALKKPILQNSVERASAPKSPGTSAEGGSPEANPYPDLTFTPAGILLTDEDGVVTDLSPVAPPPPPPKRRSLLGLIIDGARKTSTVHVAGNGYAVKLK